jgi:hypothetical protein
MLSSKVWISILFTIALIASRGHAGDIEVTNPSFEDYIVAGGFFTWHGEGLIDYGWEVEVGAPVGVFHPNTSVFPIIPDGVNTAYSQGPIISQVLSEVLVEEVGYTLTVGVGNPANVAGFPGYKVQLWAGNTLLAEDDNTLTPAEGGFQTSAVEYTSPLGDPSAGQLLEIRLVSLGAEVNFDMVQLQDDVDLAPESKTWGSIKALYR